MRAHGLLRCARNDGKKGASVIDNDLHYYEPANGHGLKHDPFNAIVAPRPIGWISSRDAKGNLNLAPYSFFNAFCYTPPIVGFSSTSWKDSVQNIQETKEFVWNLATMDLAQQMNLTAAHVARDVSEFKIAGLTATPSKLVNVPRVAESPVSFDCRAPTAGRRRPGSPSARSSPSTSTRPSSRTASTRPRWRARSCAPAAAATILKFDPTPCSK
jgi:flavin reductase (DIM6/NTAB) family NADH-FMN oxidoreductase RutF